MAIDRNKVAQQAERLLVQGKIPEAIAQYEFLVKDNPRDMNTINKIGDLYSRLGKRREAIFQFNKIGEFYAKDGFFLKAIAIYKKITKLDPSYLDAYQRLADLYAQQGLVLEARSQYQMVADQYLKAGELRKAISAFQSLVRVDPDNLKHRAHLADLLGRDGRGAEAAEEYARVGAELERKGQVAEARAMYQKGSAIQPGSPAVVARLAGAQAAGGDVEGGIRMVKDALKKPGDHKELLALLGELHLKAGQHKEAEAALRRAVEAAPERSDLRLRLARSILETGDAAGSYEVLAPQLATPGREGHVAELIPLLEQIARRNEGELDPLVKLAELYATHKKDAEFTKTAQRVVDLCIDRSEYAAGRRHAASFLKLRPDDRLLREKLELLQTAEAAAAGGQQNRRESRKGEGARPDGDASEAVTPAAQTVAAEVSAAMSGDLAAVLDLPAPSKLEPEDEDFITEHMTEADVFVKYGLGDRAVEQLATVIERYPDHVPALSKLKEIYLEEGNREGARQQMSRLVKAHLASGRSEEAAQAFEELKRFDPNCQEAADLGAALFPGGAAQAVMTAQAEAAAGRDAGESGDLLEEPSWSEERGSDIEADTDERAPTREELEEVDGFLGRGSREEAVTVLRRLALSCGSHPEIVSRMRAAMSMPAAAAAPAAPSRSEEPEEFEITLEESEEEAAAEGTHPPEATASRARVGRSSPAAQDDLGDLSDLASEIDAALGGGAAHEEAALGGAEASPEGHSLDEIVQAFKKGIEEQIGAEDFDTHYNLGIAYKEMGLMDEAIGEFQFAAKEPRLLVDCCSMLGICFREKGMSTLAVKWYRRGLESTQARDEETMLGLRYDLAELLVEMGEHREALDLFTEVFGINSKYRDVAARIKDLERQLSG